MAQAPSKRAQIIKAALDCFIKHGVADASTSAIAKAAKVDPPLVHYHFPTREILYREAFLVVLESLKEASVAPLEPARHDPVQAMSAYVRAPFDWMDRQPGYASIWLYFYYLSTYVESFRELSTQIRQVGRQRIEFLIFQGVERGVFRLAPGFSAQDAAAQVQALITGAGVLYITETTRDRRVVQSTLRQTLLLLGVADPRPAKKKS